MQGSDPVGHDAATLTRDELLDRLTFLDALSGVTARLVRGSFVTRTYVFGEAVFTEGEAPDAYYAVLAGRARVVRTGPDGKEVALNLLEPGSTFGEAAVLDGTPRSATVRASSPELTLLRLDGALLRAVVLEEPDLRDLFGAAALQNAIADLLRTSSLFGALPREALVPLIEGAEEFGLAAGETLFNAGDAPDHAYLVREGRLGITLGDTVRTLVSGDVFGERAVLRNEPRSATVAALDPSLVLRIDGQQLKQLIAADPALKERVDARLRMYDERDTAERSDAPVAATSVETPTEESELAQAAAEDADKLEPEDATDIRPPKRRKFKIVRQVDERDCGAACLAMLCRHFGHDVAMSYIRYSAGTSVDGTSLGGLRRGGAAVGLDMRLVKSSAEDVDQLPLPAVIHWEGRHWVVLTRIDGDRIRLADPAAGARTITRDELAERWTGYAALPTPTARLAEAPRQRIDVSWLKPVVRPLRREFGYAVLLGVLASALLLVVPILTGVVFDKVLAQRDHGLLHIVALSMLGAGFVGVGALMLQRLLVARLAQRIDAQALDIVTARLLGLPLDYFQRRTSVDIERRLSGVRQVRGILLRDGVAAIAALTQIVAVIVLMFVYSWVLALAFVAGLPLYGLLMRYSSERVRPAYALLEEAFARYVFRQIDSTKGIETIKVMGAEAGLGATLQGEFMKLQDRVFRTDVTVSVYQALTQAATLGLYAVLLWLGALQVLAGHITVGELVTYNTLVLLANPALISLLRFWDLLMQAGVLVNRLQDVFDAEPEQRQGACELQSVTDIDGRVRLRRVGFSYPMTPDRRILEDVTLDIQPGTTVALVGRSGSGKSTLAKCIAGMLVADEGSIEFDGVDIRNLELPELRRRIGFVLQTSYLFSDTIARNISLGEKPELEKVRAAAEIANAAEFIERMPLGYNTQIGESGLGLSGGQAQRIAIARAIYHQPPVIVLDEATSALDAEAERAVTENIQRLLVGRTAFIIAHRLSTIRSADIIAVLEQGRLVETGSHDELIARRGLYYHLNSQQLPA